jgi:dTDP-glucose 4,6-dehydratase
MWFIIGGNGWIGKQVIQILDSKSIPYHLAVSRMDQYVEIRGEILKTKPDRVVCLAGRTSGDNIPTIDYLEGGREKTYENVRDNLFGPMQLCYLTKELGIHFAYLGTGCIFNYDNDHSLQNKKGFKEEDEPNFFGSSYSIVKGFTDRLFHFEKDHMLNIRIRMPINEDLTSSRNFIHKITHYEKICSISNSMTVLPDLIPIMVDMIDKKKTGTVNLVNPGTISHNEILDLYKEIIDPEFTYQNFTLEEQNQILRSHRSNNRLDTTRLESEYFVLPIYDSIKRMFKRIHKEKIMKIPTRMNTILVTGGYGFIGSNFIHLLHQMYPNCQIINIDKVSYCSRREHLKDLNERVISYITDINNMEFVLDVLKKHKVDTVVHFAAQSHVDNSFNNSIQFTQDNVSGTHNLLEACKRYNKLSRFIHISTDEVYGETIRKEPFKEFDLPNPTNPYAATKISAEFLVQSYFHCFDLPVIIIRGNNVYGPRQYPEKIIPKFIVHLASGKKCTIHGSGNTRRNFIYVEDICRCILTVVEKGQISEIYNIGTENEWSVLDIAHQLITLVKGSHVDPKDYIEFIEDRFYNDFQYRIDSTKVENLGWKPQVSFQQGLKRTIEYYLDPTCLFMPKDN